jgi:DMSO/TMAO reductase YedYZ molybdopterin-dependent catalytic subunit
MKNIIIIINIFYFTLLLFVSSVFAEKEIREYKGKTLNPFNREYDNSIRGPANVDIKKYRLDITGLVQVPQSLTYEQILKLPAVNKVFTLHCVEGWSETLLFEGVRLADLLKPAKPKEGIMTVIFFAADGYSSSISYKDAVRLDVMLAYKINGKTLDAKRGFPLQLVAESKLGYKWVKWVSAIQLSKDPYKGYWEEKGYDNDADVLRVK